MDRYQSAKLIIQKWVFCKDKYEHRLQKGEFTVLDNIEAKSKLENVLSFLPNINPDGLVDNISYDFVSYCSSF